MSDMSHIEEIEELNPHWKWDWRKKKKLVRNRSDAIERLGYFENCSYMPAKVTKVYPYRTSNPSSMYGSSVEGTDLVRNCGCSCSMFHCAPIPLSEKEALERVSYFEENGMVEYMVKYLCDTPEQKTEMRNYYAEKNS